LHMLRLCDAPTAIINQLRSIQLQPCKCTSTHHGVSVGDCTVIDTGAEADAWSILADQPSIYLSLSEVHWLKSFPGEGIIITIYNNCLLSCWMTDVRADILWWL